ncbi:FAD-dependent oxidoreductase [Paraburkholderia sp. 35.1]|uniref:FAD-dependent oxidoreductase n=1 Tax=Paraburkholderia sp. 35.1 TaxID=2991058 RepID=UPI003D257D86
MTTTYPLHSTFTPADQPFPSHADVVIGGAGIMGCAAAYFLAWRGLSVAVLDKSRIAGQQSSRAWGFVRQQGREAAEVNPAQPRPIQPNPTDTTDDRTRSPPRRRPVLHAMGQPRVGARHRRTAARPVRRSALAAQRFRRPRALSLLGATPVRADVPRVGSRLLEHRSRAARRTARRRAAARRIPVARRWWRRRSDLPAVRRLGGPGVRPRYRGAAAGVARGDRGAARRRYARDRVGESRDPLSGADEPAAGRSSDPAARAGSRRRVVSQPVGRRAASVRRVPAVRDDLAFPCRAGDDAQPRHELAGALGMKRSSRFGGQ